MKKRFLMLFMMLLLSALVVTAAGYAWFTASSQAEVRGTQVRAETQGVLKVWTAGQNAPVNQYSNYTTYIDFSKVEDPFYNPLYTDYAMKDQSGNGSLFYQTEADGVADKYTTVAGHGVALVYDLYFSAYSGNPAENQIRDVFLSTMTVTDVSGGSLKESIRIGFLDANDKVFGVFNPNQTAWNKFVTAADYDTGDGKPADGDPHGTIIPSTSYDPVVAQTKYIAPKEGSETSVREIQVNTTICQIDAGNDACPGTDLLRVVIWIEGSDPNTLDDKLADSVSIKMVFEARIPADSYSLITFQNGTGVTQDNPEIIPAAEFVQDADGDSGGTTNNAYYLNAASRDGYDFAGWYSNAALTVPVPTCTVDGTTYYVITQAYFTNQIANIYAKWTVKSYSLSTVENGTSVIHNNPGIITANEFTKDADGDGEEVVKNAYYLNGATQVGYEFDGWYSDAALTVPVPTCTVDGTTYYVITQAYFTDQIANIYAKWTPETP